MSLCAMYAADGDRARYELRGLRAQAQGTPAVALFAFFRCTTPEGCRSATWWYVQRVGRTAYGEIGPTFRWVRSTWCGDYRARERCIHAGPTCESAAGPGAAGV